MGDYCLINEALTSAKMRRPKKCGISSFRSVNFSLPASAGGGVFVRNEPLMKVGKLFAHYLALELNGMGGGQPCAQSRGSARDRTQLPGHLPDAEAFRARLAPWLQDSRAQ